MGGCPFDGWEIGSWSIAIIIPHACVYDLLCVPSTICSYAACAESVLPPPCVSFATFAAFLLILATRVEVAPRRTCVGGGGMPSCCLRLAKLTGPSAFSPALVCIDKAGKSRRVGERSLSLSRPLRS
jgi:hypothetical protein